MSIAEQPETGRRLNISELAPTVGMTPQEADLAASFFAEKGWVRYSRDTTLTGYIDLTAVGAEEIERLSDPWWKQLLHDRAVHIALISAVLTALAIKLADLFFGK
jgi:hypothetical protein